MNDLSTEYVQTQCANRIVADTKSRLITALLDLDKEEAKKKGYNRYAIALYLQAADACSELVLRGSTWEDAFSDCFTPCRGMHKVARAIGLKIDVEKGLWIAR